jgi:DNA-binding transcriptional regulator YiaG
VTGSDALRRQNVRWLAPLPDRTVLTVDDQPRAFKRAFAAALVALRAESGIGSQTVIAKLIPTSEATYRRWEALDEPHMPDAWQVKRLCEVLECEPAELIRPEPLSERERQLARRVARGATRGSRRAIEGGQAP